MPLKETTVCMGYQQITSLSGSTGLTVPTNSPMGMAAKPVMALLQAEVQNVRWRDDGTAPTASVGMILYVGADPYPYDGDLTRIRFIEAAASGKLNVTYLR
jgi:hypothetical protein